MTPRLPERGFTLLELLVALVVLGALMLALANGTRFGLLAWRTDNRISEQRSDIDAVSRTLGTLLAGLDPGDMVRSSTVKGDGRGMTFTTELPFAPGPLPIRQSDVTIGVDKSGRLFLASLPHVANWLGPPRIPQVTTLLEGVRTFQIAYWQANPGGGGAWVAAWTTPGVPRLVRFHIATRADRGDWPDIVVSPMRDRFQP